MSGPDASRMQHLLLLAYRSQLSTIGMLDKIYIAIHFSFDLYLYHVRII